MSGLKCNPCIRLHNALGRRCVGRQFLLVPDEVVNDVFLYAIAVGAKRFNIHVHAAVVMSNHWHAVVTDPDCNLPGFTHFVHGVVARAVNAHLGRWDTVWSGSGYSAIRLLTREDQIDRMVYALLNPVAAGLVAYRHHWPGLLLDPTRQTSYTVKRPSHFFCASSKKLPAEITLTLQPLPGTTTDEVTDLNDRVSKKQVKLRKSVHRKGKRFKGAKRVCQQKWTTKAKTPEKRRGRNPHIACHDATIRIAAILARQQFLVDYAQARRKWLRGRRRVRFPCGTYQMRLVYRVNCQPDVP